MKVEIQQRLAEAGVEVVEAMVTLDEERRASMVSNLLVVLCSDRGTQPVVNAGSLYNQPGVRLPPNG